MSGSSIITGTFFRELNNLLYTGDPVAAFRSTLTKISTTFIPDSHYELAETLRKEGEGLNLVDDSQLGATLKHVEACQRECVAREQQREEHRPSANSKVVSAECFNS
jgi:hypothetical protein